MLLLPVRIIIVKIIVAVLAGYTHAPGGALTLEGSTGMCRPQDPLFQAIF